MKIVHYDVDQYIEPFLEGRKEQSSLQELRDTEFEIEAITIKSISKATEQTLSLFPNLKLLVTRTVGTDHIDLEECKKRNIAVYHIIDYGASNIAEHVFALLLSGTRRVLDAQKEIQAGRFSYAHFIGLTLREKTLGVIGTGKIGLEVIKIAQAFGMKILAYDVYQNEKAAHELGFEYVEMDNLLSASDIFTLHAPLLDSTRHIINEEAIQKMKQGAVLINTARGGLIDTRALVKHINKFRFVGLDVLEDEETFTKSHPLLQFDNVIITPHIAFFTDFTVRKIAEETRNCIQNFLQNSPNGRVE